MKAILLFVLTLCVAPGPMLCAQDVSGTWQGTLHAGKDELRTVVKIASDDGRLKGTLYSIDQGGDPFACSSIKLQGDTLTFAVAVVSGSFSGKLNGDGNSIVGKWTQGGPPLPLTLVRANEDTAWEIPKPAKHMAKGADPAFEVATIKPSKPGKPGGDLKDFSDDGRNITTTDTSLDDLIEYAYDVHLSQILGGPAWTGAEKFDVAGIPDQPGDPSNVQMQSMLKKLLADRFQLKFHTEKKQLPVYVLTVAKNGPKNLTKSGDPDPDSDFDIGIDGARGGIRMTGQNATMTDFAVAGLQGVVLDRPCVDETAVTGRYDFALTWLPDFTQFEGRTMTKPVKNPQPDLFTAIQQQLGLKLEPRKTMVDVMVIDHVERPSAN